MAEYWDVYDASGEQTGQVVRSGDPIPKGAYHLAVAVWVRDSQGRWLISKRSPETSNAGIWQCTEGGVVAGEDSLTGALREVQEELGVSLEPENGVLWHKYVWPHADGTSMVWYHTWVFEKDVPIEEIVLQEGETCDAMWATAEQIREMVRRKEFIPYDYLERLFEA